MDMVSNKVRLLGNSVDEFRRERASPFCCDHGKVSTTSFNKELVCIDAQLGDTDNFVGKAWWGEGASWGEGEWGKRGAIYNTVNDKKQT